MGWGGRHTLLNSRMAAQTPGTIELAFETATVTVVLSKIALCDCRSARPPRSAMTSLDLSRVSTFLLSGRLVSIA